MKQFPVCGDYLLKVQGDSLDATLALDAPRRGRAALRTDLGGEWHDVPMRETAPGRFSVAVALDSVGVFSAKACFFPEGRDRPEWPDGPNFRVKVQSATTRRANSIYTVFPRQFGGAKWRNPESEAGVADAQKFLDAKGYNVIPPSGTFRDVVRSLGHVMDDMGFRIVQLLPIFPVPTTFARMGRYGCPFAALDFLSVDPALAEFDERATPLDQFRELARAVHSRGGDLFIDLPANHTGWAATLQTHHPEWYRRADGRFVSPGAWGVTWADLAELDYSRPGLREYMADVFLFWCRQGVDGFRCDAGYMIPADTWIHVVKRVREQYPDTVFMLEGLGGKLSVTDDLLARAGLDWAYSEIFQTYDRRGFESYLPDAIARAEKYGPLVHFAETHDNDRLAKGGKTYARLRVALAALFSHQGAWGIANGVEWFAAEKIDVHGASSLNWGAADNMVSFVARLNALLRSHPAFGPGAREELVTRGDGNVFALVRRHALGDVLVVANLDCERPATVHWDGAKFPRRDDAIDLLTGRAVAADSERGVVLAPGEAMALGTPAAVAPEPPRSRDGFCVRWRWPLDARREAVVPDGAKVFVSAPHPFRVRLCAGDRAVAVARSSAFVDSPHGALLAPPKYAGDGTRGDDLRIEIEVYAPSGTETGAARLCLAPTAKSASAKLVVTGDELRADPTLRVVLANGLGAAAYLPAAWGEVRSQYDATLAANPKVVVPGDRLVLWTRTRAWMQCGGFSREFNRDCVESFAADPAGRFAVWRFSVPCGMGRVALFDFRLSLPQDAANAARLDVARIDAGDDDVGDAVRVVFRPDLEWRSFHATTKAQGETERAFATAVHARRDGFSFAPYGADSLAFSVRGGEFHHEQQWTYCVAHPDEAERGQEPCGDLFSPGWISCDFAPDGTATLFAEFVPAGASPVSKLSTLNSKLSTRNLLHFADALRESLGAFVTRRDDVKTVLAGYPWFLDWGRDTFIFLRGAIAAGYVREAQDIVVAFARCEENGTLPNIIYGGVAGNRDTSDAPLWFIVAVGDLVAKVGRKFLKADCGGRPLSAALDSIAAHYVSGTTNGIRVDEASGLVWSPSHFTWMDTNYPACTPRVGYPVEIQALWIAALRILGGKWKREAERAAESLVRLFARPQGGLCDCLDAPRGESAADAKRDGATRPNQIFVLSLDALPSAMAKGERDALARGVLDAVGTLVTPHGVRSLDADDPRWRGAYTGGEDASRKPAYHNGTAWAWPMAAYAESLAKFGAASRETALSLLASTCENLNSGCLCHLSEIADGDAPHAQKGCRAQAWSESEILRVWLALS